MSFPNDAGENELGFFNRFQLLFLKNAVKG